MMLRQDYAGHPVAVAYGSFKNIICHFEEEVK
jgi:hypothetical protein